MVEKVAVKPELIQWAAKRSRLPLDRLKGRFTKLEDWISGAEKPTIKQLEDFASYTLTPLGYFFLISPPDEHLGITDFRTVKDHLNSNPSPELLETIQSMQERQDWMREYLKDIGQPPLDLVGSAKDMKDVRRLAATIRTTLDLDEDWSQAATDWQEALRILRNAIEAIGILVMVNSIVGLRTNRKLDPNEFRGFVLIDEFAPLIFVNGNDAQSAQMFTLAHELVHVWVGRDGLFDLNNTFSDRDEREKFCNQVAAEFLAPEKAIRSAWDDVKENTSPFRALAKRFKVSPIVAARRAFDLKLVGREVFFAFYKKEQDAWEEKKLADKKKEKSGGPSFYVLQNLRLGNRFSSALIAATREGRLLYRDAFRLTDMHGDTFSRYASLIEERARAKRA